MGRYRWDSTDTRHGGFSGLALDRDGRSFTAISDRGWIARGTLGRDPNGAVSDVALESFAALGTPGGHAVQGAMADAEGLAVSSGGDLYVSFEQWHRVWVYPARGTVPRPLPMPAVFANLQRNAGLEALARAPDGALYTLPERSGAYSRPFPVYKFEHGRWTQPFKLPRRGGFLPVGADFGPDGRFYLLERRFDGLFGFASRVRRFVFGPDGATMEETLLVSANLLHDNLEGIAVWRDSSGAIRLTLMSDDNYGIFQHTEFVDYRVTD